MKKIDNDSVINKIQKISSNGSNLLSKWIRSLDYSDYPSLRKSARKIQWLFFVDIILAISYGMFRSEKISVAFMVAVVITGLMMWNTSTRSKEMNITDKQKKKYLQKNNNIDLKRMHLSDPNKQVLELQKQLKCNSITPLIVIPVFSLWNCLNAQSDAYFDAGIDDYLELVGKYNGKHLDEERIGTLITIPKKYYEEYKNKGFEITVLDSVFDNPTFMDMVGSKEMVYPKKSNMISLIIW